MKPLVDRLLAGERAAIARAISAFEQNQPQAPALAQAIAPHRGRAHVIGLTGAPGAGKSTLVEALLGELLQRGQRIGVIAVDPSSPLTGGAVLGDRVRMGTHGAHENVFIRSVASRGHLGGLSRETARLVDVLDAAGFDTVVVETVGAGQSEVEILRVADTRIVACPPGLGDEVQALKAGILEIADLLVVTKGDLPGAEATRRDLQDMVRLRRAAAWTAPVLVTCAARGEGVREVIAAAIEHRDACGHGRRLSAAAVPPAESAASGLVWRLAGRDAFARQLGIECVEGGAGHARVRMTVGDGHLNFHGNCHGGVVFTLADAAFGLASNSHGRVAAGIDAHITYQVAVRKGDTLLASAVEVSRSNKLAVYRIDVTRGDGKAVASFTGTVYVTTVVIEP